jgi:hypothetical protein
MCLSGRGFLVGRYICLSGRDSWYAVILISVRVLVVGSYVPFW